MSKSKYVDIPSIVQVIGNIFNNPKLLDMEEKYFFAASRFPRSLCKIKNLLAMELSATENSVAYLVKSSASFTKP